MLKGSEIAAVEGTEAWRVAEGKESERTESCPSKGGAAYRDALTAGGGGGLLEAVGFRVETDDVMLK